MEIPIKKMKDTSQTLYNLRRMMRVEKDLDLLLDFIVEESAKIVNADRASLFLYDPESNELCSKIALGSSEIVRFDSDNGLAGEVFKTGKAQNVTDAYKNKKFNSFIDKKTGYKTTTLLCVPLKNHEGKSIGVLQALNKLGGFFTSDDEQMLELFASNAAVAIENARLIKDLAGNKSQLETENKVLREKNEGKFFINNIIGTSPKITEVVRLIEKIAGSPLDVLITGESGTGKELAARMIHYNSPRAEEAFIDINCAALPNSILESELFGVEKGVATGVDSRQGKIELANNGILFLDEIGEMSMEAQTKLLRALQERKINRLGGKESIKVDFRVVAATNKNLQEEILNNTFREDLFYRLNVVHIEMPQLKDIKEDIPVIAKHFLDRYSKEFGRANLSISSETMGLLQNYPWLGNVRELENEIKRAIIISEGDEIKVRDFSQQLIQFYKSEGNGSYSESDVRSTSMKEVVKDIEIRMIHNALKETNGNKQKASELLGITRQGLFKKMKRYGLL